MNEESAGEYGLVMPFVCCKSNGGAYDDTSFVAGATMEAINSTLAARPVTFEVYVPPGLLAQLDLVAMRHGYAMVSQPWDEHPDEWALASFAQRQDGVR